MRLDPNVEFAPSNILVEAFTTNDHTESEYVYYQSEDEKTICGVWKCAPCVEEDVQPAEKLMTVISGVVNVIYKSSGITEACSAVDSFYLPKGEEVVWEIT